MKSQKIRDSAKGESCTVRSANCNYNSETTVLAHLPFDGGMGKKPTDLSSCFACSSCHDLIDRRVVDEEFEWHREWYLRRAQVRTMTRLFEKGVFYV